MKGEAIKAVAAKASANVKPSDDEIGLALAEGVDILLAFFADVGRIATAATMLSNPFLPFEGDGGVKPL